MEVVLAPAVWVIDPAVMDGIETSRALEITRFPSRAVPPMTPVKEMSPAGPAFRVKFPGPFTVLEKEIGCEVVVSSGVPEVETGPVKEISPLLT